jgi:hypothetical protein
MIFTRRHYFFLVIMMLMITTYLPVLTNQLPPVISSHHFWAGIWGVSLLAFYPRILSHKLMITFVLYALFILLASAALWPYMDGWNRTGILKELYMFSVGISIYLYFVITRELRDFANIAKWSLVFIFITAIMTIYVAGIDPMYARNVYDRQSETEVLAHRALTRFGPGDYATAMVFMSVFPILVFYYRNKVSKFLNKRNILIFGSVMIFALVSMQIFGNILILMVGLLISIAGVSRIKYSVMILGILIVIATILPKSFYVDSFIYLSEVLEDQEELSFKFADMAYFMETGGSLEEGGATAARVERFPMLFNSFIQSPVFGCYFLVDQFEYGYREEGGHLYWMNKLTVTGLVGFIFFISVIYLYIKRSTKLIHKDMRFYFLVSLFLIIAYGFIKNVGGRQTWYMFFVIYPGLCYLPMLHRKRKQTGKRAEKLMHLDETGFSEQPSTVIKINTENDS